jgi:aryl-alcohol dehydrogenase-like predicted oxidoreductase
VGFSAKEQYLENMQAVEIALSEDQIQQLNAAAG